LPEKSWRNEERERERERGWQGEEGHLFGMRHVQSGVHIFICIWRGVVVWLLLATCDVASLRVSSQKGEEHRLRKSGKE